MTIAGQATVAHAFALVLCYSRRSCVRFFRDERLPTLLWAHQEAFTYHAGVCRRIAYEYVPRNIFILLCPAALCGRGAGSARRAIPRPAKRAHNAGTSRG